MNQRDEITPVESIVDAKSAIRWTRQHARELGSVGASANGSLPWRHEAQSE